MSKHIFAFLPSVLLVLLAGCRSERATHPTPMPPHYWTALEAYEQIKPAMLAWHEDAVVVLVVATHEDVRIDGKSTWWNFIIYSPGVQRETEIYWIGGEIRVGMPDIVGGEVPVVGDKKGLSFDGMIDSDEAVKIASRNGVSADEPLVDIRTEDFESASDTVIPPSWRLTYGHPHDWSRQRVIIIDAVTGKVLRNDFAE